MTAFCGSVSVSSPSVSPWTSLACARHFEVLGPYFRSHGSLQEPQSWKVYSWCKTPLRTQKQYHSNGSRSSTLDASDLVPAVEEEISHGQHISSPHPHANVGVLLRILWPIVEQMLQIVAVSRDSNLSPKAERGEAIQKGAESSESGCLSKIVQGAEQGSSSGRVSGLLPSASYNGEQDPMRYCC